MFWMRCIPSYPPATEQPNNKSRVHIAAKKCTFLLCDSNSSVICAVAVTSASSTWTCRKHYRKPTGRSNGIGTCNEPFPGCEHVHLEHSAPRKRLPFSIKSWTNKCQSCSFVGHTLQQKKHGLCNPARYRDLLPQNCLQCGHVLRQISPN